MHAHIEDRGDRRLPAGPHAGGRIAWLFARTRTECEALVHEALSWDETASPESLIAARHRLTDTLGILYAHPLLCARFKDLDNGSLRRAASCVRAWPEPDLDTAGIGTLIGWLYVAEGARLHLHVLARMAARAAGRPTDPAESSAVSGRWGAFVVAVERAPLGSADLCDMLAGARSAFRYIRNALEAGKKEWSAGCVSPRGRR